MLKPILIGSLVCAWAEITTIAQTAMVTLAAAIQADSRDLKRCIMLSSLKNFVFLGSLIVRYLNNDRAGRNGPLAEWAETARWSGRF
jgi:hypothetical protein